MSRKTLYWLQCGACGGDTWSLANVELPNMHELFTLLDMEVLYHPSLSVVSPKEHARLLEAILAGEQKLDFLCVEGSVIRGPGGTGMYDTIRNQPKKDLLSKLAFEAEHVIAVGTCASFGGIGADGDIEATGVQYMRERLGGFLGREFRSKSGSPVVNLPGCPCHGEVLAGTLTTLARGGRISLGDYNSPEEWYGILVHQGCVRNEYHEYRVEEREFGEKGCLFFYLGCRGPLAHGPCNKLLWNRRSSKTRVGVPCVGCTEPSFPQPHPFFKTQAIADVPIELPDGVDRAHYLAYKGMAAAAAPERLKQRKTQV
jgi:uptake hydrogenase small subunit